MFSRDNWYIPITGIYNALKFIINIILKKKKEK